MSPHNFSDIHCAVLRGILSDIHPEGNQSGSVSWLRHAAARELDWLHVSLLTPLSSSKVIREVGLGGQFPILLINKIHQASRNDQGSTASDNIYCINVGSNDVQLY